MKHPIHISQFILSMQKSMIDEITQKGWEHYAKHRYRRSQASETKKQKQASYGTGGLI